MTAILLDREGNEQARVDRAAIQSRLSAGEFFWLELEEPDESEFAMLRDLFRFHPLALEDSQHFGQRPKLEEYVRALVAACR